MLEVLAITDAFVKWSPAWQHSSVHVYTDNTVALAGLQNTVLKGPAVEPSRILLALFQLPSTVLLLSLMPATL